ncbi:hypothetical protein [Nocardioides bruguierae]|uniref:Uncharacterized protein n=1 Tax=Nocardioides bruguierae TaxID=2945102 RepID=A0A9X2IDU8_9ACTN|nr:hypothetical protein [Nocardioides bruguierae]MCL8024247.1 hypothetical protein [Nocardioides bruguierae]MCM0618669.1 hypothetical protein [Nocardioides bruguierae]
MRSPHAAMAALTVCLVLLAGLAPGCTTIGLAGSASLIFLSLLGRHRREQRAEAAQEEAARERRQWFV